AGHVDVLVPRCLLSKVLHQCQRYRSTDSEKPRTHENTFHELASPFGARFRSCCLSRVALLFCYVACNLANPVVPSCILVLSDYRCRSLPTKVTLETWGRPEAAQPLTQAFVIVTRRRRRL